MSERSGIEIDYCPSCRGVWLDRGELDKIIERSVIGQPSSRNEPRIPDRIAYPAEPAQTKQRTRDDDDDDERRDRDYAKKRKRESFLGELFDF